ncbi:class I SAM-dependent methyltransferase [Flavobacterium sp. CYK-55]|uniref:class I SAM-dependent methyltransferase n=1 Tax=Flavobacterium sp. CYK-55 TaxID=2835529 RepID=UPI001BD1AAF5|nr:class I SAM-dependent methyltransferase [Flavobacterium sp. CYK-55]MBS7786795.1 class I SAM-dependent methyltransferase [Flavobacterium sp. CYK-55]
MSAIDFPAKLRHFVIENTSADVVQLALQKNPFPEFSWTEILEQISGRKKAQEKLPTWFSCDRIVYPSKISVEQTSSEATAEYKSSLISGNTLIDLTGGFGVDTYYFAQKFKQVVHCEFNASLSEIVSYNYEQLKVQNIECVNGDGLEILQKKNQKFDWIYLDPARRNDRKGKVFMLEDCTPNVAELLPNYFEFSNNILIKTAPILDIHAGLKALSFVKKIHIVALENEVKEILWQIEQGFLGEICISSVNISRHSVQEFSFILAEEAFSKFDLPQKYLYEPNAAIMKSGGFTQIVQQYGLSKLQLHSHLYTSEKLIDFPGRSFKILEVLPYQKAEIKQHLQAKMANVTVRNFPETVEDIRKKWKIKSGGDLYCFFTTDMNNRKIVLLCSKI